MAPLQSKIYNYLKTALDPPRPHSFESKLFRRSCCLCSLSRNPRAVQYQNPAGNHQIELVVIAAVLPV